MLVKELQALALDVRVLDKNGEEIQLSTLCNDEEPRVYSNKADLAAIDEELSRTDLDENDLDDLTVDDEETIYADPATVQEDDGSFGSDENN